MILTFPNVIYEAFFTQLSIIESPEINLELASLSFLKTPIVDFVTDILMDTMGYPQKWFIAFDQSGLYKL
jgi:hypothetical protein